MFEDDLKAGEEGEKIVEKVLKTHYGDRTYKMDGNFKWFDYVCVGEHGRVTTVEVKTDRKFKETGNVAIEINYKDRETLKESKAEVIVYLLENQCWGVNRLWLIEKIKHYPKIKGGDNKDSELVLIPVNDFTFICNKL